MAKKPGFYAVKLKNGIARVLTSWPDAQTLIKSEPKGARYKRFDSEDEANAFLTEQRTDAFAKKSIDVALTRPDAPEDHCVAFVDGSYNAETMTWGYGVVLYDPRQPFDVLTELSGSGRTDVQSRNVTGELHAAVEAIKAAIRLGYKGVEIYHDYQGVASWANATWATNCDLTMRYKFDVEVLREKIDVNFHKVTAHTGIEFNERADVLAKRGCGLA